MFRIQKALIFFILFIPFTKVISCMPLKGNLLQKSIQEINFSPINDKTCRDSVFNLQASSSSGLPVFFKLIYGNALISGNTISITGPGSVGIEASQPGDQNFEAATPVFRKFEVTSNFFKNNADFIISLKRNICEGDKANFFVTSIGGLTYQWTGPKSLNIFNNVFSIESISIDNSGLYKLKVKESYCTHIYQAFNVTVNSRPIISFTGIPDSIFVNSSPFSISILPPGGSLSGKGLTGNLFVLRGLEVVQHPLK